MSSVVAFGAKRRGSARLTALALGVGLMALAGCSGGGASGGPGPRAGTGGAATGQNNAGAGGGINTGTGINTGINTGLSGGGIKVPGFGGGVAGNVRPNAEAWATNTLNDLVEVFDLQQGQSVATIPVTAPMFVERDRALGRMLVVNADKELHAFDETSRQPVGGVVDLSAGDMTQYGALSFLNGLLAPVYFPTGSVTVNGVTFIPGLIGTVVVNNGMKVGAIIDVDTGGAGQPTLLNLLGSTFESLGAYAAAQSGGKVYVTNMFSSTVTVIDPQLVQVQNADPVVDTIPIVGTGGAALPTGIVADDQGKLYVTCFLSGEIAVIDTRNNNAVNYLPVTGGGPIAATFRPGGGRLGAPLVYVANFFDGTVVEIDTRLGLISNTYQVHNSSAFFSMIGLSPQQFQQLLQQAFGSLGFGQAGNTTTGGAANMMSSLLAALSSGQGGGQALGGVLFSLIGQLMQAALQQAGIGTGQGGVAGSFMQIFQSMPVPGLTDVELTQNGTIVAGSIFGGVAVFDPAANTGTTLSSNAAINSTNPNGGMPLAGLQAVAVRDR